MSSSKNVIAGFLRPFGARVRALGKDPVAIAVRLGLPDFEKDARTWLSADQVRDFLEEAARVSGDADLGLNAALQRPLGSFGLVELGAGCAPDLRGALRFRLQYAPLLREASGSFYEEDPREARVGFLASGERERLGRHANEFRLVSGILIMRAGGLGEDWAPLRVWFSHPEPRDTRPLSRVLNTRELYFEQSDNGIAIAIKDLDRRTLANNPPLFAYLERQAQRAEQQPRDTAFAFELRQRMNSLLSSGTPAMEELAKRMHMSPRTLHRRLAVEKLTFQTVLDQLRREIAEGAVGQSELSSEEISQRLGYASVPTFLRAFKRWTGMNPSDYRRKARARRA